MDYIVLDNLREYASGVRENRRLTRIVLVFVLSVAVIGAAGIGGDNTQPVSIETEETGGSETTAVTPTPEPGGQEDTEAGDTESRQDESAETSTTTDSDDDSSITSSSISVDGQAVVSVQKDEMRGAVDDVLPGDSGNVTLTVRNEGNASGRLQVTTTNVSDFENGQTEPELPVDDSGGDPGVGNGELSSNLLVRWVFINSTSDNRVTLTDGYVPIEDVDETVEGGTVPENGTATALFEWKVPETAGNEIQSDSVTFDIDFTLVSG